jgi:hypothetical protein
MGTSLKNPQQKGSSLAKNGLNNNGLGNNSSRQIPSTKGIDLKGKNPIGQK